MARRIVLLASFILFAGLFSCSSLQQLVQPPDVKVEDINIADFSFEDVTLDFGLLVNNPNAFGIDLQGYEYSFAVEGKEFLSASEERPFKVDAAGASTVQIPVTINFKKLLSLIKQTQDLDSLNFDLVGKLHPGGVLSAFNIPFERSGRLPNVRIPEIKFSGVKIKNMGFSGIDLELGINVINKNVFGFNIGKLDYDIALAGASVARGVAEKLASVPAKGAGEIKLPISLNFSSALTSLSSALNSGAVQAAIKGRANLGTPFGPITLPFDMAQEIPVLK